MARITVTAAETTDPRFVQVRLSTDSRQKADDPDAEEYRAILEVVVEQDAETVQEMSDIALTLTSEDTLTGSFNGSPDVVIDSIVGFPFKLIDQTYTELEAQGSKFFRGKLVWVSTTTWFTLLWT